MKGENKADALWATVEGSHMVICEAAAWSKKMWTLNMEGIEIPGR